MADKINLPLGVCVGCPCWITDGTCLKDKPIEHKCRNCKYAHYEAPHGYVCTNTDSEHISYFLDGNDWCEKFEEKERVSE